MQPPGRYTTTMVDQPELQFESEPPLRDPHLVIAWAGWNDAGESASTAARYLAATLSAEPFASIDPEEFYDFTEARPLARYRQGVREIIWPSTDFYAVPLPARDHDLILAVGIEPNFRWKRYMDGVHALIAAMHVRLVVTLGAVAAGVPHTQPVSVSGSANSPELAQRFDMHPSRYEGPTGIVGVFHDACRRHAVDGVSLWAAVPHYLPGIANPLGARAAGAPRGDQRPRGGLRAPAARGAPLRQTGPGGDGGERRSQGLRQATRGVGAGDAGRDAAGRTPLRGGADRGSRGVPAPLARERIVTTP